MCPRGHWRADTSRTPCGHSAACKRHGPAHSRAEQAAARAAAASEKRQASEAAAREAASAASTAANTWQERLWEAHEQVCTLAALLDEIGERGCGSLDFMSVRQP